MVSGRPAIALLYWLFRTSPTAQFFQLGYPRIDDADIKLTAKYIVEARNAFLRLFNRGDFYVLMYPDPAAHSRMKNLIPYFESAQVKYLDYSELFDPSDPSQGLRIEHDPHPTPKAYRLLAEQLTHDLSIREVAGQKE